MARKPRYTREGIRHGTINGHRFHLRLTDPTKENFLWIDGRSPPLVLDQVAAEFVGLMIDAMWAHQQEEKDETEKVREQVVETMYEQYGAPFAFGARRVTRKRIQSDLDRIFGTIMAVAKGSCPVEEGIEIQEIRQDQWAAPARMDLALTYRCNLDCTHCYTGGPKEMEELSTKEWLSVYEILWWSGIPQIVFTGGEPTLREDLVDLVSEADEYVTGLVTNGTKLEEMAEALNSASLDYVQVTLESHDPEIHNRMVGSSKEDALGRTSKGIRKALDLGMEVVTNTTLTRDNADSFTELLRFGKELGLKDMACNSLICSGRGRAAKRKEGLPAEALRDLLRGALETAKEVGINLQWYTPTCYHRLNPLELGFGPKSCSAAAHNMTVQPDGTVLPCQSWPESVGSILQDPWPEIWNHPTCRKLREHGFAKEIEACAECGELHVCGGGCPLDDEPPGKEEEK